MGGGTVFSIVSQGDSLSSLDDAAGHISGEVGWLDRERKRESGRERETKEERGTEGGRESEEREEGEDECDCEGRRLKFVLLHR